MVFSWLSIMASLLLRECGERKFRVVMILTIYYHLISFESCSYRFLLIKAQRTNDLFGISISVKLLRMKGWARKPTHPQTSRWRFSWQFWYGCHPFVNRNIRLYGTKNCWEINFIFTSFFFRYTFHNFVTLIKNETPFN